LSCGSRPGRYRAESQDVPLANILVGLLASLRTTAELWRYAKPF